jgi:hypothetical protein
MLALHASHGKKVVYFLAERFDNLHRFHAECARMIPEVASLKEDYHLLLDFLKDKLDILIIDEFPNMIAEDENVLNIFQSEIDQHLASSRLKMVILGSSVSVITSKVLASPSPLYGRKTRSLKLGPINFMEYPAFFPSATFAELVEIHGFGGGIPYYLNQIPAGVPFWDWLSQALRSKTCFLRDEMEFLLRYEFTRPETYMRILNAIAAGNTKPSDIANYAKLRATDLPPYLALLMEVDFVVKQWPVTEGPHSRNGRYFLKDNFLKFVEVIQAEYPMYLGAVFEDVVLQFLLATRLFPFSQIGRWWWKSEEIDLVAFDSRVRVIHFIECKWSDRVKPLAIARRLVEKASLVNIDRAEDRFVIFAKSFTKKIVGIEGIPVSCFDLADMSRELERFTKLKEKPFD